MKLDIKEILGGKKPESENWIAEALEGKDDNIEAEKVKSDENPTPNTTPTADPVSDATLDSATDAASDTDATPDPNPTTDAAPAPTPTTDTNTTSDQANTDIDATPDTDTNTNPDATPDPNPTTGADTAAATGSNMNPDTDTNTNTDTTPDANADPAAYATPDSDTDTDQTSASAPAPNPASAQATPTQTPNPNPEKKSLKDRFAGYGAIAGIIVAFAVLLLITFVYTSMIPRDVYATVDGKKYKVTSTEYTIGEFLEAENISYCKEDFISKPVDTYIHDGISFELRHAVEFTVTVDGKTKKYRSLEETVGEALIDCGIKYSKIDIVTPLHASTLEKDMEIIIQRVDKKRIEVEEKVAFKTVNKDDTTSNEGTTKVITEGKDGLDKVVYEVIYVDGKETARTEVSRETIKPVVDKVVAKGTRINYNGKSYSRKLVVKAYSYTGGGRTAMGTRARVGEIAVDPKVIPLGTNVYIEGVGARRAEDTGGNIKGNTIDIYMNSVSECRKWGVRYVTIYIQ